MLGKHVEYEWKTDLSDLCPPSSANIATKTQTECSRQNLLVGQGKIKSDLRFAAFDYPFGIFKLFLENENKKYCNFTIK